MTCCCFAAALYDGTSWPPPHRNIGRSSSNPSAPTGEMCSVPITLCAVPIPRPYPRAVPILSFLARSIKSGRAHMRTAGPTLADARQHFNPCGISCCDAASGIRPASLYTDLCNWERCIDPNNIAKLARLGANKGVLNKIC